MGTTLPSLERYLATLPGGIDAYPQCLAKASIARDAMQHAPAAEVPLPDPVRALIAEPPPVSAWIPEVHQNALMLAILDTHFHETDLDGYYAWVFERNRRVLSSAIYRALFFVISPERLLTGFQRRWITFRRGTELTLDRKTHESARLRLTAPAHLHTKLSARGIGIGFHVALERAGGADVRVDVHAASPTEFIYDVAWR